ncbi:hypothetical protein PHLGIDRAFT_100407 [Phlebiopsis gigantea 11061_1 CR5-6]|uniref:HIT domain-containing protein n=1 Tax=Phlebiopsis gigantea (strain 11061_1 CR5-6) TaxID=745531 RepID=A0A0C3PTY8_PHLG1|nr:hypothetical protein PHLGIDRAFT_100407 [Phlebiopsis gigantea 11061_1 CR5-6]
MLGSCFGILTSCIRTNSSRKDSEQLSNGEDDTGYRVSGCTFCGVSKEKGFDVVWEDDAFVVFNDRNPASKHHLLVIPRRHVESVKTLKPSDASMVARMAEIGHDLLDELGVPPGSRRLGFHIPPFNSINHLHLHVQGLPYKSLWRRVKYPYRPGGDATEKGFGWFIEVEQAIRILEKRGSVSIRAC